MSTDNPFLPTNQPQDDFDPLSPEELEELCKETDQLTTTPKKNKMLDVKVDGSPASAVVIVAPTDYKLSKANIKEHGKVKAKVPTKKTLQMWDKKCITAKSELVKAGDKFVFAQTRMKEATEAYQGCVKAYAKVEGYLKRKKSALADLEGREVCNFCFPFFITYCVCV